MHAEIITTGTELLLGHTVDTNSAYIARALTGIGLDLFFLITVGDNEERMASMLEQALERSDVIITTGGLGPTVDDVTRAAVARATRRALELRDDLLLDIEGFFARTGRSMSENNRRQAYIPAGAIPIRNPVGTAPAFIVEDTRGTIISLPGVPREMEYLMQNEVLPYLSSKLERPQVIKSLVLHTCSIGESSIDNLIGDLETYTNPTVGLAAHPGQTDVRLTAKGASHEEVDRMLAELEAVVRERLGDVIFGVNEETLEEVVARQLVQKGRSLALVESNTDGMIAGRLRSALEALGEPAHLRHAAVVLPATAPLDVPTLWEAARQASQGSGADITLYIAGTGESYQGVFGAESGQTAMILITRSHEDVRPFRYGGRDSLTQHWIFHRALDLLRRELMGLRMDLS